MRWGILAVTAVALSCSGGSTAGAKATAYCQARAAASCNALVRCGGAAASELDACVTLQQNQFCAELGLPSILAGHSTFDEALGQACVERVKSATCAEGGLVFCRDLVSPAAATGEACTVPDDCKLETDSCGGVTCPRTCQPAGAIGKPCLRWATCDVGQCDPLSNLCVAPNAIGEPCNPAVPNQCPADAFCNGIRCVQFPPVGSPCAGPSPSCDAASAYCDGTSCRPLIAVGSACVFGDSCVRGSYCGLDHICTLLGVVGSACNHNGQCVPGAACLGSICAAPRPEGAPCADTPECEPEARCDVTTSRCTRAISGLGLGEPCTLDARSCDPTFVCAEGTCQERSIGGPCNFLYECPATSFCVGGVCVASGFGSLCLREEDCAAELFCSEARCVHRLARGAPCPNRQGCEEGSSCVVGADAGFVCGTAGAAGAACTFFDACLFPFVCTSGRCAHGGALGERCLRELCISGACLDGLCVARFEAGARCNPSFAGACLSSVCLNDQCQATCR